MHSERLLGADNEHVGEISLTAEGPVAIAISRGGAKKRYPHKHVNEDAVGYAYTPFGVLGVVADGHAGREAAESAISRILERHGPRWVEASAMALEARFVSEAGDVVEDVHTQLVEAHAMRGGDVSRTTLAVALARPREGFLAAISFGDSHVFRVADGGASEWLATDSTGSAFLGTPSFDRDHIDTLMRVDLQEIGTTRAIVLATDGLSERGIGVADPTAAVAEAGTRALSEPDGRVPAELARGVTDCALESQLRQKAGDNIAVAALQWEGGA